MEVYQPMNKAKRRHILVHFTGVALGLSLAFIGGKLATMAHAISEATMIPHLTIDVFAWGLHGFGLIPAYRHAEHIWDRFTEDNQPELDGL